MNAGLTPPTGAGTQRFLRDVIVEMGFISPEKVAAAEQRERHGGVTLESVLIGEGYLTADQLARAIAERHGLDHVDLAEFKVDVKVARLITADAAERYQAVPIGQDPDGSLLIAVADPVDSIGISDIAVITHSKVRPVVASATMIEKLLHRLGERDDTPTTPRMGQQPDSRAAVASGVITASGGGWGDAEAGRMATQPVNEQPRSAQEGERAAPPGELEPPATPDESARVAARLSSELAAARELIATLERRVAASDREPEPQPELELEPVPEPGAGQHYGKP